MYYDYTIELNTIAKRERKAEQRQTVVTDYEWRNLGTPIDTVSTVSIYYSIAGTIGKEYAEEFLKII